jgi:hypothetical protein
MQIHALTQVHKRVQVHDDLSLVIARNQIIFGVFIFSDQPLKSDVLKMCAAFVQALGHASGHTPGRRDPAHPYQLQVPAAVRAALPAPLHGAGGAGLSRTRDQPSPTELQA